MSGPIFKKVANAPDRYAAWNNLLHCCDPSRMGYQYRDMGAEGNLPQWLYFEFRAGYQRQYCPCSGGVFKGGNCRVRAGIPGQSRGWGRSGRQRADHHCNHEWIFCRSECDWGYADESAADTVYWFAEGKYNKGICTLLCFWCENAEFRVGIYDR